MNTLFVFALLVAGTQAGFLHQPAVFASAPVALAAAPLADTFQTPLHTVYDSDLSAADVLGATGRAAIVPGAIPFVNNGGIHNIAGAYNHYYAAPSYGFALKK